MAFRILFGSRKSLKAHLAQTIESNRTIEDTIGLDGQLLDAAIRMHEHADAKGGCAKLKGMGEASDEEKTAVWEGWAALFDEQKVELPFLDNVRAPTTNIKALLAAASMHTLVKGDTHLLNEMLKIGAVAAQRKLPMEKKLSMSMPAFKITGGRSPSSTR